MAGSRFPARLRALLWISLLLGLGCRAKPEPELPPRQLSLSAFHYPEDLWDAGVEGKTMLRLYVAPGGSVDSVRVQETSGHAAFDTAAVRGSAALRFAPAQRGDRLIGAWVDLPVRFEMGAPAPAAPPPSSREP
ncbi:MAG: energy transducer TonB [Gemmatimonadota bacterium]|jgi:protein TonB|nr:energy transducer TonB [Gemmatimonadota bacterium]